MFFFEQKKASHHSTTRGELAILQPSNSSNSNRRNLIRTRPIQWQNGAKAYLLEAETQTSQQSQIVLQNLLGDCTRLANAHSKFLRVLQKGSCFLARPCSCLFEFHIRKFVDILVSLPVCHSGSLDDRCDRRRGGIQMRVHPSRQWH